MKKLTPFVPLAVLGLFLGCGGGGGGDQPVPPAPKAAASLVYTDPTSGVYQLRRNAALSTPASHLVLELWGPAGSTGSGASVAFTVDPAKAVWSNVAAGDPAATYLANGSVFALGSGTAILKAKVSGGVLAATVAEKGTASPKSLNGALLRVALDLTSGTVTGTVVPLTADAVKCQVLMGDGSLATIAVTPGVVTAQ